MATPSAPLRLGRLTAGSPKVRSVLKGGLGSDSYRHTHPSFYFPTLLRMSRVLCNIYMFRDFSLGVGSFAARGGLRAHGAARLASRPWHVPAFM